MKLGEPDGPGGGSKVVVGRHVELISHRMRRGRLRLQLSRPASLSLAKGLLGKSSKPVVDDGDVYGRGLADGEFVVADGQAAVVFERVYAAFDGVPVLVCFRIERGWSATAAPSSLAVGGLVMCPCRTVRSEPRIVGSARPRWPAPGRYGTG